MSNSSRKIVIRADANREMGIGHAMRCLAVAEQLIEQGHSVTFAMHQVPAALADRLMKARLELHLLSDEENSPRAFRKFVEETPARHVILDGYHIGNEHERAFSNTPVRTLRFDDYMPGRKCNADVVVNASPHANNPQYARWAPDATLLLGQKYIAFRSEMIAAHDALTLTQEPVTDCDKTPESGSILINFGGSDHLDMTARTATAISKLLPNTTIEAVTGAAYANPERLTQIGIANLIHHHNTSNLPEIMQRASMAISAGGLTVTELALFRIPTILAITAQNQIKGAHVSWCHTIQPAGKSGDIDTDAMLEKILSETERLWHLPEERAAITGKIPKELDIFGAKRIVDTLLARD
jgi:UDP-2,4-diacetamido-2,4,6-trideoxy-beta-L-altropyranose hydrolase